MRVRSNFVMLRQHLTEEVSKGGILLTDQRPIPVGTIIKVGPAVKDLSEGDVICFAEHSGHHIQVEDKAYYITEEEHILAVLGKEEA